MTTFKEMGLSPELLQAIEELGFTTPMPVQEEAIPELLNNDRDLVALAQTGTGKTAAFGLPIIQQLNPNNSTEALILSPTRELCVQIGNDLKKYSKYIPNCSVVTVYGGASIEKQKEELRKGAKIVVATPGRLLDLIRRRYVKLDHVATVVLDESDEMLDMGFKDDLDQIIAETPATKRTLLFSATMAKEVEAIAKQYMTDPFQITVGSRNAGSANVSHQYYIVNPKNRYAALKRIVDFYPKIYAIIFCKTKAETQEVASALMQDGYNADALHGDLSQAQRDYAMQRFRVRNLQLLVATDVAARGLDVNDLTHVINYNLPSEPEQYTHRSGRTGRANKKGISISIITPKEMSRIKRLEQTIKQGFEYCLIPSGKEICEKQLFSTVDKMEKIEVNYEEIEEFLPVIQKKLEWMDKDELIRRFVSVEFNHFLNYYRQSQNINVDPTKALKESESSSRRNMEMGRLSMNIGYRDRVVPQRLIALINEQTGNRKIKIGRIDITEHETFIDVDSQYAQEIANSFENVVYKGVALVVKVSKRKERDGRGGRKERSFDGKRGERNFHEPFSKNKKKGHRKSGR